MRVYKAPYEKELELYSDALLVLDIKSNFLFAFDNKYKIQYPDDLLDCKCIGWFTEFGVEFYVFDKKLVLLKVYEFHNIFLEIRIGAKKGMKVYHGTINYHNKNYDSNKDGIPDVVDFIMEMCKYRELLE
jgi:hypothetical protein